MGIFHKIFIIVVFIFLTIILGCKEEPETKPIIEKSQKTKLKFLDKFDTTNTIDARTIKKLDLIEDLVIDFFDKDQKIIYFHSSRDKKTVYRTAAKVDSAFQVFITNTDNKDIVYIGSFNPTTLNKFTFTFLSIYSFNPAKNVYQNSFNVLYQMEKKYLEVQEVENFNSQLSALFVATHEGSGNFLEFVLIMLENDEIKELIPDLPPLSQGEYKINEGSIWLMEGLMAWQMLWSDNKKQVEIKNLDSIPIFDYRPEDKIINFKRNNGRISTDSRIYVCNWTGVLHLQTNNPSNDIQINYNPVFFDRKFNQLIPKKKGLTYIEIIDPDFNFVIHSVKIVIN